MPRTFTQMLSHLKAVWPEQPRKVQVIAARYYLGVDRFEDLQALVQPQIVRDGCELPPTLSVAQATNIAESR